MAINLANVNISLAQFQAVSSGKYNAGEIRITGTDIDKLMPPVSRFGGGGRARKKQGVIDKLKAFFERFFGLGNASFTAEEQKPKAKK